MEDHHFEEIGNMPLPNAMQQHLREPLSVDIADDMLLLRDQDAVLYEEPPRGDFIDPNIAEALAELRVEEWDDYPPIERASRIADDLNSTILLEEDDFSILHANMDREKKKKVSHLMPNPLSRFGPSGIKITLENQKIWKDLHPNNEMIATKCGRRMFPVLKYKIEGLDSRTLYFIDFHLERVDLIKYKYENQEWREAGRGAPILPTQYKMHPDGVRPGSHWMKKTVSFAHIKITNDPENRDDKMILVQPMHRYFPVVTVTKIEDNRGEEFHQAEQFRLELTKFFVVTSYQSEEIVTLKIAHNNFARELRLNGKRSSNSENTSPTETKRGSSSSDSSSSSRSSTVSPPPWNPLLNNQLMFNPYPPVPFPIPNQYYDAGTAPNPFYWNPYFQENQ